MGLFFWIISPCVVLFILEGLLVSMTNIDMGRFVIPVLAGFAFFVTMIGSIASSNWDSLGWALLSIIVGSGLLGSLLGLGIGQLLRRLRWRKPE